MKFTMFTYITAIVTLTLSYMKHLIIWWKGYKKASTPVDTWEEQKKKQLFYIVASLSKANYSDLNISNTKICKELKYIKLAELTKINMII